MTIQILGGGCANCDRLEKSAKEAIAALNLGADLVKIKDFAQIARMGVMSTPALAVDNVVLSSGRVLNKDQVIETLRAYLASGLKQG